MTKLRTLVRSLRATLGEGVIKLDLAQVRKLSGELVVDLADALEGKKTIEGVLVSRPTTITDVRGKELEVYVKMEAAEPNSASVRLIPSGAMGYTSPKLGQQWPVVILYVNSAVKAETLYKVAREDYRHKSLADQVYEILVHELTHAADIFSTGVGRVKPSQSWATPEQALEKPEDYYNDPSEVRAYMRNVVDDALAFYKKILYRVPKLVSRRQAIDWAIKNSSTWQHVSPYFTTKNRKLVMKTVVAELDKIS